MVNLDLNCGEIDRSSNETDDNESPNTKFVFLSWKQLRKLWKQVRKLRMKSCFKVHVPRKAAYVGKSNSFTDKLRVFCHAFHNDLPTGGGRSFLFECLALFSMGKTFFFLGTSFLSLFASSQIKKSEQAIIWCMNSS